MKNTLTRLIITIPTVIVTISSILFLLHFFYDKQVFFCHFATTSCYVYYYIYFSGALVTLFAALFLPMVMALHAMYITITKESGLFVGKHVVIDWMVIMFVMESWLWTLFWIWFGWSVDGELRFFQSAPAVYGVLTNIVCWVMMLPMIILKNKCLF